MNTNTKRKFTSHLALVMCSMAVLPYGLLLVDFSPQITNPSGPRSISATTRWQTTVGYTACRKIKI